MQPITLVNTGTTFFSGRYTRINYIMLDNDYNACILNTLYKYK